MFRNNGINKALLILNIILIVLFVLSFTTIGKKTKDKRKVQETTLLNPKNVLNLDYFELSSSDSFLILKNLDRNWILINEDNSPMPVNNNVIVDFLSDLTKRIKIYKISESFKNDNKFGFDESNYFKIRYYLKDGTASEFLFGNYDFSLSYKYFMTGQSLSVYQIDSYWTKYLNTSIQNWSDPYLISRSIFGVINAEDLQSISIETNSKITKINSKKDNFYDISSKLLELRHGGSGNINLIQNTTYEMKLILELGTKNSIDLEIYNSADNSNDYILKINYYDYSKNENQTYYSKISIWTYNRIKEIML